MRRFLIPLLIFVGVARVASAADSTVTALPAASALTGPELSYCIQGAADKKCTATQIGAFANGVFNVRAQYGAVADGSTDNTTAITNAFTAANAYSAGSQPTIYFDCNTGSTTCVYNYTGTVAGGGLSPMKMLIPMTILCAPGVTLNYGGLAHAVEIGSTTHTAIDTGRYALQGCNWTGGASYTAGLWVNNWIANSYIVDNTFTDFGNQTAFNIVYNGNNWTPTVSRNYWRDTNGVTKNILDAHAAINADLLFTDNKSECEGSGGTAACSVATTGVGIWIFTGWILNNEIKYHYPAVRLSSCGTCGGGNSAWISNNLFEGNTGGLGPAISYGDPGTAGAHIGTLPRITYNMVYWPVATNVNTFIGPESASSGSFQLDTPVVVGNNIGPDPTGTGLYIQTNGASGSGFFSHNYAAGIAINQGNALFVDSAQINTSLWNAPSLKGGASTLANKIPVFDASGVNLNVSTYHNIASEMICADTSGSGTAQACDTNPKFSAAGSAVTLSSGDMILYKSTTQNAGSLTIAVNGGSAVTVKKTSGTANLAGGEIKANFCCYPMTYDGTNLNVIIGQ